jgi:hypothetical protein
MEADNKQGQKNNGRGAERDQQSLPSLVRPWPFWSDEARDGDGTQSTDWSFATVQTAQLAWRERRLPLHPGGGVKPKPPCVVYFGERKTNHLGEQDHHG